MVLFHDIIQIFHLTDSDVRAMCFVIALDGGCIGVTAVNGDGLRQPVTADGFLQEPEGRLFVAVLRQDRSCAADFTTTP